MDKPISIERHIKAVEDAVDHIAYVRRMAELDGADMAEFDKALDAKCNEYHAKYAVMGEMEIALHGVAAILKSDRADEFLADMSKALREKE